MKRDDMVKLMAARFEFYDNKYPGVPLELIMDYVLKGMEARGMLPPETITNDSALNSLILAILKRFKICQNKWDTDRHT